MNGSESNYFNLTCVIQLLVCSGLAASAEGWPTFWRICHGRTWVDMKGNNTISEWGNPTCDTSKIFSPSRKNPSCGVGFALASEWEKSHQRSCEASIMREGNPCSRVQTPSAGISQRGVMYTGRSFATIEWGTLVPTYKLDLQISDLKWGCYPATDWTRLLRVGAPNKLEWRSDTSKWK